MLAELVRQRLDEDRQRYHRRTLPGKPDAAQAAENDPTVEKRQAQSQETRQGLGL
jgi:hypothetical protein